MENSGSIIVNRIRSGSIGGVSGVKGGALAGAFGGLLLMLFTNLDLGNLSFLVFSMILGATTGMMAGALICYFVGFGTGFLSELLYAGPANQSQVSLLWYAVFILVAALLGYFLAPAHHLYGVLGGALLGSAAAFIAIRDFIKMLAYQAADADPADLRTR